MAYTMGKNGLVNSDPSFVTSAPGYTPAAQKGTITDVDVYQPEQWDAFRQFQSGAAYDSGVLNNYLSNYIDPTYQKIREDAVNKARNQYGATPSGYFSASTLGAQNKAMTETGIAQAQERAKAAISWDQAKKEAQMKMLEQRPIEKIYEPPAAEYNPYGSGGGYNTVAPRGNMSSYENIGKEDIATKMGWNKPYDWGDGYSGVVAARAGNIFDVKPETVQGYGVDLNYPNYNYNKVDRG
jgi:hypothetical protein